MSALQSPSVACFATQSLFAGSCASPPSSGLPLLPTAVRSDVGQKKTKRETFGRCVLSLQKMKHRKHRAETPRSNQRPVICRQTLDPPAASRAVRSQSSCVSRSSLCPHHAQRLSQMNEPSNKVRCAGKRCGSRKMAPSLPTLIISPDRSMTNQTNTSISAITKRIRNTEQSFAAQARCYSSHTSCKPRHSLPRTWRVCCSISSIGRRNLIQVSAVLALPLCPTMLPCSMMNHTRTWVL